MDRMEGMLGCCLGAFKWGIWSPIVWLAGGLKGSPLRRTFRNIAASVGIACD